MTRHPLLRLGVATLLAVAACSDDDGPQAPSSPQQYRGAVVQGIPDNVLAAAVLVNAAAYDSAYLEYQAGAAAPARTPAVAFAGDTLARVPVLGLDTATSYTLRVRLTQAGTPDTTVDSLSFTSGSLPSWIPAIGIIGTSTQPGYLALSLPGGPVIVDNTGKVVWYLTAPDVVLNSFQAHPAGVYTLSGAGSAGAEFQVLNALGEQTGVIACVNRPTRFHEVLVAAGGDAWVLCDETRVMDLSALGGNAAANVTATVVQHLSASGALLWEWNAFDHFAITDLPAADRAGPNVNFTHGNGLGFDADGNLLLGFRSLSEVTKVNVTTGEVMWRFGGLANQFTIANDPKGAFERQHGVRWAGPGQVQLLDNGLATPSRFARYLLNPTTHTAVMAWQFVDAPATWTAVGGSTQYHPDGHGTVSFGRAGRIIEVDEAGNRAWELTGLDGVYVFRVQRIGSLYGPGRGDPTR